MIFQSDFIHNFPLFMIILCLLSAVSAFIVPGKGSRIVTIVLTCVCITMNASVLAHNFITGEGFTYMMGHYPAPFGNEVAAGIMEPFFATLFGVVILCSALGGTGRIERDTKYGKRHLYYGMIDLTQVALYALCYTNDIFSAYVFIEVCTLASCALLMIRESGKALVAATRYMIFALIGSGLFLIGIILMYDMTGHLLFPQLRETIAAVWASGEYKIPFTLMVALIVSGLAIKSGLFPFHFWMPDTYGTATPASAGILSGVVSKGYIFLLIKVIYKVIGHDVFMSTGAQNILFIFGVGGMIIGSLQAIRSKTINQMTSFSSAAQIGYIYMGIGMGTGAALVAVFFHICAHAITKPLLFMSAGALYDVSDHKWDFYSLRGSGHRNPLAGFAFLVGCLSMIGFPIFTGFISKMYFAISAFDFRLKTAVVLCALAISTILNVIYFMYTAVNLFKGSPDEVHRTHFTAQRSFAVAAIILVAVNIYIGLQPQPFTDLFETGINMLMGGMGK